MIQRDWKCFSTVAEISQFAEFTLKINTLGYANHLNPANLKFTV